MEVLGGENVGSNRQGPKAMVSRGGRLMSGRNRRCWRAAPGIQTGLG